MKSPGNPINPYSWQLETWPDYYWGAVQVAPLLEQASSAAGELKGLRRTFSDDEQHHSLIDAIGQEAQASFEIEGEKLSLEEITASVAISLEKTNIQHVAGNYPNIAEMMLDVRNKDEPITADRLHRWHRLIFESKTTPLKVVGGWRESDMEIVSGPIGKYVTEFEAPPPDRVPGLMDDLLAWIQDEETVPTVVKAALAHLWFETIHPYEDGNGRIGRAISEAILLQSPFFSEAPFSLSRAILSRRAAYYAALKKAQRRNPHTDNPLDVTAFVAWFAECVISGIEQSKDQALFIVGRNKFFRKWEGVLSDRQELVLKRLFAEGPDRISQGLSNKPYTKIARVSAPTAARDLKDLLDKGVLLPSEAKGRNTSYLLNFEHA
jgi:Fic family protein